MTKKIVAIGGGENGRTKSDGTVLPYETKEIDEEKAHTYIFSLKEQESFFSVETKLFIYPGFEFRIIDQIITNFHLPKSSLLMLVSAAMGRKNALQCYQYAIEQGYKFYSFGDGMWIKSKNLKKSQEPL